MVSTVQALRPGPARAARGHVSRMNTMSHGVASFSQLSEPLSESRLRQLVTGPGRLWTDVRVVAETGSTNADLLAAAGDAGEEVPDGRVLAAEIQTAGRGRQGRTWESLPGAALTFSVLLRPRLVPKPARGWLPLLAGVAAATAVGTAARVGARLKWPNDVLVDDGKLAGILAEQTDGSIVVGIGLNVLGGPADLPVATATSLQEHGAGQTDRTDLLAAILTGIEQRYVPWRDAGGDPDASGLRPEYLSLCATVGRQVRVELPGQRQIAGTATGVDVFGQLLVQPEGAAGAAAEPVAVSAGDVIHIR
jgi:BirA family transcriptional regulator, biotin operon repressor / biotin---[acetyl-CoA-carboxylase] ligase